MKREHWEHVVEKHQIGYLNDWWDQLAEITVADLVVVGWRRQKGYRYRIDHHDINMTENWVFDTDLGKNEVEDMLQYIRDTEILFV